MAFLIRQHPSTGVYNHQKKDAIVLLHGNYLALGMKTNRIRTDITDITFVFIFFVGLGFQYG